MWLVTHVQLAPRCFAHTFLSPQRFSLSGSEEAHILQIRHAALATLALCPARREMIAGARQRADSCL
jgi:hypothetical protein